MLLTLFTRDQRTWVRTTREASPDPEELTSLATRFAVITSPERPCKPSASGRLALSFGPRL